eukprot:g425.t1
MIHRVLTIVVLVILSFEISSSKYVGKNRFRRKSSSFKENKKLNGLSRGAFTIPLRKSEVDEADKMQFLRQLKLLQIQMREIAADVTDEDAFIQEDYRTKLTQQVLPEKRLATYYGEITFGGQDGTEKQTFPMLFDTGSCEFWVPSKGCKEKTDPSRCNRHRLYDETKSSTYESFGEKLMSIKYLSGAVEGPLAKDTVTVGDNMVVKDQVFGMARQIDVPLLDDVVWDGIIGLAYPNEELSGEGIKPLFDNIMDQGLLLNNVFSYYLGIEGGAVVFGGIDERYMGDIPERQEGGLLVEKKRIHEEIREKDDEVVDVANPTVAAKPKPTATVTSEPNPQSPVADPDTTATTTAKFVASPVLLLEENSRESKSRTMANIMEQAKRDRVAADATSKRKFFNYAKVTDKGYWTIEIEDILLRYPNQQEPESTGVCRDRANGRCTAIVDTGTYLIYGPQDQVNNQLGKVMVSECDDVKTLPDIIFQLYAGDEIAPAKLTLHPHDYTLEFRSDADCTGPECSSECVLGIGPDDDTGWTLGQVFLRSFYTVFDRDNDRIGFTRANPRAEI